MRRTDLISGREILRGASEKSRSVSVLSVVFARAKVPSRVKGLNRRRFGKRGSHSLLTRTDSARESDRPSRFRRRIPLSGPDIRKARAIGPLGRDARARERERRRKKRVRALKVISHRDGNGAGIESIATRSEKTTTTSSLSSISRRYRRPRRSQDEVSPPRRTNAPREVIASRRRASICGKEKTLRLARAGFLLASSSASILLARETILRRCFLNAFFHATRYTYDVITFIQRTEVNRSAFGKMRESPT